MKKDYEGTLLIDTRERFCEVGLFATTETESGDLILRRVLSLGSLWDLENDFQIPNDVCLAIMPNGYKAYSSEGFVEVTFGNCHFATKNVAAVLSITAAGNLDTAIRGFEILLIPGGKLYFPQTKAIDLNDSVASLGKEFLSKQIYAEKIRIAEGQSNTFQYAEVWPGKNHYEPVFRPEHNEKFKNLVCINWRFFVNGNLKEKIFSGKAGREIAKAQLSYFYKRHMSRDSGENYYSEPDFAAIGFLGLIAAGSEDILKETGVNLSQVEAQEMIGPYLDDGWDLDIHDHHLEKIIVTSPSGDHYKLLWGAINEPKEVKERFLKLRAKAEEVVI